MGKNLVHDYLNYDDDEDDFEKFTSFERFSRTKGDDEKDYNTDAEKLKRKKKLNHQRRGTRPDKGA